METTIYWLHYATLAAGYSGCLAVEHLDALLALPDAKPHRWAIAGRQDHRACPDQKFITHVRSEAKLQKMAAKCRTFPKAGMFLQEMKHVGRMLCEVIVAGSKAEIEQMAEEQPSCECLAVNSQFLTQLIPQH